MSVAPFSVAVVPIKGEQDSLALAEALYGDLQKRGIEVLLDDRNERPGVKFKDLDLMGIPLRVVISDKTLPDAEVRMRKTGEVEKIPLKEVADFVESTVRSQMESYK
jgi:prolyl-tRNA synthetase